MKSSFFTTAICLLMMSALIVGKALNKCVEPSDFTGFNFEQFINTTKAQSYSITPGWYEALETADKVPSEYIKISHKNFLGNLKCKKQKGKKDKQQPNTLNSLAQCMWRFVENTDRNRKPETLLEVDCVCPKPVNTRKRSNLVCQSVIEYVNVFRKIGCINSVYEYKRVWEPRAVACVAAALPEPKRLYSIDRKTPI